MKEVPRRAENRVAEALNQYLFTPLGLPEVKRMPITGRTGPDVSWNDYKIIIDGKSRREVPKCIFVSAFLEPTWIIVNNALVAVPIIKPEWLLDEPVKKSYVWTKLVGCYYDHMEEWTRDNCPDGITALALRKPGMHATSTIFVVGKRQIDLFRERYQCLRNPQINNP